MSEHLEKVVDLAKKLRNMARRSKDTKMRDLVTDLNLCIADLKVEMAQQQTGQQQTGQTGQQQQPQQRQTQQQHMSQQHTQPEPAGVTHEPSDDDLDFTY